LNLRRAVQAIERVYMGLNPPLTMPRLIVLRHLERAGSQLHTQIVQGTGVDKSTLGTLLKAMGREGLVKFERGIGGAGGDARTVTVWIATRGRRAMLTSEMCLRAAETMVFGRVTVDDLDAARRFAALARAAVIDADRMQGQ
jgi:DNA-binding MarR family transcriptional regulator